MSNNKIITRVLPVMLLILFCILLCYNVSEHGLKFTSVSSRDPDLSKEESRYISQHKEISVYVDPSLQYLLGKEDGYLNSYLSDVFGKAKLTPVFITDPKEKNRADCCLNIVTSQVRKQNDSRLCTVPLMEVQGAIYVREDPQAKYKGILVSKRLTRKNFRRINYDSRPLSLQEVSSNEAAVRKATRKNSGIDYIIGDRNAIRYYLGDSKEFVPQEKNVYTKNVCIYINHQNETLCDILNACLQVIDRHELSNFYSEKWMNGNAPTYKKDVYTNAYIIIIILIMAIGLAFLLYYIANRNLYEELQVRMDKLNASRKELKTTFNGIRYFLAELNLDGDIIDINRSFYEYLGFTPSSKKIWDVIHLDDNSYENLKDMCEKACEGVMFEGMETTFNGKWFFIEVFPIEGISGDIEKLLFMASNVTNEKMAEKQMLQDNKMIAVGQLASGVAHEIRNPLGIIRNYCYVLKNMKDEEVQKTAIQQIEKAVETSGAIIENLLDFSRASSKKMEQINIGDHVEGLLKLNESLFKKKAITVTMQCENVIFSRLVVESLDMILINLISNAVDAMDDRGALQITITENEKYGLFRIDVEDNGSGIDPDVQAEIFNPFFTTKIDSGGTGLGLYIVYNEIEKLNGTISVDSIKGQGTTFRIVLPMNMDGLEN